MWGVITMLVLFFGGYYVLSYREKKEESNDL